MPPLIEKIDRPVIMAHRGASAHAPENTLSAFRLALDHGADGFELDTKLTADGKVVVIHDPTVDRTTGGHGAVRQMTLEQIRSLDAGRSFHARFEGERVPTLEEVFEALGDGVLINIEVANYTSPFDGLPDAVVDLVKRHNMQDRVLFSSFYPSNILRLRKRIPRVPAALLTLSGMARGPLLGRLGLFFSSKWVCPYYADVNPEYIQRAHAAGKRVNVWTVNQAGDMRRLFKMRIDGIITDNPLLAKQVLEEK